MRPPRHLSFERFGPITIGHAVSIAIVARTVVLLGLLVDPHLLEMGAGLLLIGRAAHHAYRHRHRVRVGMTTGMVGLGAWSFVMATAHGAA